MNLLKLLEDWEWHLLQIIGDNFALFEPVHGAAFDIAGKNIANPSSFLLSIKMMLDWLGAKHNDPKCFEVAAKLESTIFVKSGIKTKDIGGDSTLNSQNKLLIISKLPIFISCIFY